MYNSYIAMRQHLISYVLPDFYLSLFDYSGVESCSYWFHSFRLVVRRLLYKLYNSYLDSYDFNVVPTWFQVQR
jgi:hypothetical protein